MSYAFLFVGLFYVVAMIGALLAIGKLARGEEEREPTPDGGETSASRGE